MDGNFCYEGIKYNAKGRLIYLDPNDIASFKGYSGPNALDVKDNVYWNPEDLQISVDLQVVVPNRDDLMKINYDSEIFNVSLTTNSNTRPEWKSFFGGKNLNKDKTDKSYLTTSYTDMSFTEIKNGTVSDKESLGIESVDIKFDSNFYPQVTIKFIDIHGYSLMNPTEYESSTEGKEKAYKSFFRSLFHYPYPRFLLTIKGYFGTKVTFSLAVNEFKSNFNSDTGNFETTVTFVGYMYGIYTDIPFNFILVAPYLDVLFNSDTSVGTGDKWKEKHFLTKEGGDIKTFIEFVNDFRELDKKISEEVSAGNFSTTQEIQKNNIEIESLKELKSNFKELLGNLMGNNGMIITQEGGLFTNLEVTNINGLKDKILILREVRGENGNTYSYPIVNFIEIYRKVQKQIKNLNGYELPNNENSKKFENPIIFQKVNFRNTENNSFATGSKEINDAIKAHKSKIENRNNLYYHIYDIGDYFANIEKRINNLNSINDANESTSIDEEKIAAKKILGYDPNIENIFRMIYAHIDIFMDFFYNLVISPIDASARKISDFDGLKTSSIDVNQTNATFLPPFPNVFEEKNRKRTLVYPSQLGNGAVFNSDNMVELAFVDKILSAALQLHNEIKEIDTGVTETANNGNENVTLNFIPLSLTDIFFYLDGFNPYTNIKFTGVSENDYNCFIYILYRAYLARLFGANYETQFLVDVEMANYPSLIDGSKRITDAIRGYGNNIDTLVENIYNYLQKKENYILGDYVNFSSDGNMTYVQNTDIFPDAFSTYNKVDDDKYLKYYISDNNIIGSDNLEGTVCVFSRDKDKAKYTNLKDLSGKIEQMLSDSNVSSGANTYLFKRTFSVETYGNYPDYYKLNSTYFGGIPHKKGKETGYYWACGNYNTEGDDRNFIKILIEDIVPNTEESIEYIYDCEFSQISILSGVSKVTEETYLNSGLPLYSLYDKGNWGGHIKNKYEEFLFVLASIPYYSGTDITKVDDSVNDEDSVYTNILKAVNRGEIEKFPLGALLYIGGLVYSSKYMYENKKSIFGDWYPIYNNEVFIKNLKEKMDENKGEIPLYSFRDYEGFNNIYSVRSRESIGKIGKWKGEYLENLFKKYADIYSRITISECLVNLNKPKKNNVVKINSKLDSFLLKIYLERSILMVVTKNIEKDYIKWDSKDFLTKYINQITERTSANEQVEQKKGTDNINDLSVDTKLATYQALKNMYDKWLCGYKYEQFQLPTPEDRETVLQARFKNGEKVNNTSEFNNFLFVDSFYNDISNDFYVDLQTVYDLIIDQTKSEANKSVLEFITEVAERNKLLFLALPVYNNWHKPEEFAGMFMPNQIYNPSYSKNETVGSTYLIMYTHEVSHMLEEDEGQYDGDGLDLTDMNPENMMWDNNNDGYTVPAFGVTFGRQNQMYFKNISLNMDNPRVTDYSIANTFKLAEAGGEGTTLPNVTAQDMYSIYSNRSYNCTIEMMGCANIMPMMFFQLNNIPMYRGAYMIVSVEHNIKAGDMKTTFTGVRMSKNLIPYVHHIFNVKLFREGVKNATAYDGTGNNAMISCNCGKFDVKKAIDRMKLPVKGEKITVNCPYTEDKYHGLCGLAVKSYVLAGLEGEKIPEALKWNWYGYDCYRNLESLGFKIIEDSEGRQGVFEKTNYQDIVEWAKINTIPGDIAVMTHGMKEFSMTKKTYGHIAMKNDQNQWVSDCNQYLAFEHDFYCYPSKSPQVLHTKFYRYSECKDVETTQETDTGKILLKENTTIKIPSITEPDPFVTQAT